MRRKGSIVRKGNRYYCVVQVGKRQKWIKGGFTKSEANNKLIETIHSIQEGTYQEIKNSKVTFGEFIQKFLEPKKSVLKPSTYDTYSRQVSYLSFFNEYPLREISPFLIDSFIQSRKASVRTINNELTILKLIFDLGERWGYLKESPFKRVERPKTPKDEIETLSYEEVQRLINAIPKIKYQLVVMMGAYLGLRSGEIWALKWSDVDFERKLLFIQRSVWRGILQTPKTESGIREISIPEDVLHTLKKWRLESPIKNPMNLVFPSQNANFYEPENFRTRHFKPALKRADLKDITFHSLRRFNISFRLQAGQNLKYIAKQVGHADVSLILNRYGHLLKDENFEIQQQEILEKALNRSKEFLSKPLEKRRI